MNQELSFETIPLELTPAITGEMFEVESERGIRRSFAGPRNRSSRPGIRPGMRPKGTKHPPFSRTRPFVKGLRRPFGSTVYEPYPIASEPYSGEPEPSSSSEHVRWVQDCLNRAAGTQLPVTGIMGRDTRSAVRNFQRQQGLRASGIVGPDTEDALRAACTGQNAGENSELESYIKEPGFIAWLTWQPSNEKPQLYTWDEIQKRPRDRIHGDVGVYIVVLFERRTIGGKTKKIITKILKVGKAIDDSFRQRLEREDHQKIRAKYPEKVGYYLAKIQASGACPVRGCGSVIEHLITRTLIRAGKMLPEHQRPIVPIKALDQTQVANILPKPLAINLGKAYAATGPMDVRKQRIGPVAAPASGSGNLILPKDAIWELEYPFSEAEELELAAELLAISNEEELDLFLGKLFKGIGRGLKKFGRFVGKKVLPALGKGLKAIGKAALPIVGKALGSFIPIPGVGTAIGGAIGTAVSKALELEFSALPAEEAELERARRFVRIAATAAKQAALADPHANPEAIAKAALMAATRMHVPSLPAAVRADLEVNGVVRNEWYANSIQPEQSDQEAFLGDVWNSISTGARKLSSGVADVLTGCAPIEDRTSFTPKDKRKGKPRDMSKVYALVLHQTAGNQKNTPPNRYDSVTAHFVIKPNGQILQLHPLAAYLNASNGFNAGSVAVEFAGNFPDTRGKRYVYPNGASPQGIVTAEQIKAGRCLVRYLVKNMGLTHILAHRQSSATRTNDPGPDIWYHVGQWAINNLGLRDGGQTFKVGSGNPIPDIWRTWGKTRQQPELGEEIIA